MVIMFLTDFWKNLEFTSEVWVFSLFFLKLSFYTGINKHNEDLEFTYYILKTFMKHSLFRSEYSV